MRNGGHRKLRLAAASAAGLLLALGSPAEAQVQCPRANPSGENVGYSFTFDSFEWKLPDRRLIVYCIRNHHPTRNLFVDWPDAGLKGWVRVGTRGSSIINGPLNLSVDYRSGPLWFGSKPRRRPALTPFFAAGPGAGAILAPRRPALLRAAALLAQEDAPVGAWTSEGSIDVPLTSVIQPLLAKLRLKPSKSGALGRTAFKLLVRHIETRPNALVPFGMTFVTQPPGPDAPALRYSCTYRAAPGVLLRFDDPALHRTMFGGDSPFLVSRLGGGPHVMESPAVAAAAGVEARTGRLQVLLPDGRTVIGSIGFDYLAPKGG